MQSIILLLGGCGGGKTRFLCSFFEDYLIERQERRKRALEEAFKRDLSRRVICFTQHPVIDIEFDGWLFDYGLWTSYRIDDISCTNWEYRYVSYAMSPQEQFHYIENNCLFRVHSLIESIIVEPAEVCRNYMMNESSAKKNDLSKGIVRSELRKGTGEIFGISLLKLHQQLETFQKRWLYFNGRLRQKWKCNQNSTLKKIYSRWTSVLHNCKYMQRWEVMESLL